MVFYSFYSKDMKSCSLISLGGNSKESFWQSQRVLLKMAPSTRVYNIFLPRWFRHFTEAAEEQEAEATRNRADSFWLAGLLLESGSWRLKMQFLMGAGGWASKAEDQVGLSWYLKWKKKQMKTAPLSSLITPTGSSQTRKEAAHCTVPTMCSLWQSLSSVA